MAELLKFDREVDTVLQPIYPKIGNAVYEVSPTLTKAANDLVSAQQLEFFVHPDKGGFVFAAAGSSFAPGVRIGLGALEQAWAAMFAYQVLFEVLSAQFNATLRGKLFPTKPHKHLREAIALLRWSLSEKHKTGRQPWPEGMPSPTRPRWVEMSTIRKVNVVYLRAIGWMFGHELGHFAKGHVGKVQEISSIDAILDAATAHGIEHEADAWANEHAMTPLESVNGLACACTIGFALGIIGGICHVVTDEHPPIADRIHKFFESYVRRLWHREHHAYNTVLYSLITPLHALLYARAWQPQVVSFEDFPDNLRWLNETIAHLPPVEEPM